MPTSPAGDAIRNILCAVANSLALALLLVAVLLAVAACSAFPEIVEDVALVSDYEKIPTQQIELPPHYKPNWRVDTYWWFRSTSRGHSTNPELGYDPSLTSCNPGDASDHRQILQLLRP